MSKIKIVVDSNQARKALEDLNKESIKVDNSFEDMDKSTKKLSSSFGGLKTKIVAGVVAFGAVAMAVKNLVNSSFAYNKSMEDSTAKLRAMISASKGYTTTAGEVVSATQRMVIINRDTVKTMELLEVANSETSMGMRELIDVYALMKPSMDSVNVSIKDQIQILKLVTNTASNFGLNAEELSNGIDDLATGTWDASSGFGKMAKSLGLTKEEVKNTTDLVGLLNEKMKETGAVQDTMSVAISNFGVAWDRMAGKVTEPIFEPVKKILKELTTVFNKTGPDAVQVFSDALIDMVNGGVSALAFLMKAINQVIGSMQIAYA
jgi:hypothetical protein